MCKEQRFSESGAPIAPTRCEEYGFLAGRLDTANDFIDAQRDEITRLRNIMDKARAVSTSWEQYKNADVDGQDEVSPFLESGLERLVVSIDEYDALPGGGE